MVHTQIVTDFMEQVKAHCEAKRIAPSTFTNRVLDSTYALERMMRHAGQLDITMTRLLNAMQASQVANVTSEPETPRPVGERHSITLELPVPTSTNNLQRSAKNGRRYDSKDYETWHNLASSLIMAERGKWVKKGLPLDRPYVARIRLSDRDRADVDNRVKALLDVLHHMSVTPDDKHCYGFSVARSPRVEPGRIVVTVRSLPLGFGAK